VKHTNTISGGHIVDPCGSVCTCTDQLRAHRVEIHVQDLVDMSSQSLEHLSGPRVPNLAGPVNASRRHELS